MTDLPPLDEILRGSLEILIFSALIYAFIRFLQETRGSAVLKGFIFVFLLLGLGLVTVVKQLGLLHLEFVAERGLSIILIGLAVVFQPELRQVLVRLGEARLLQGLRKEVGVRRSVTEEIVQAAERLSRRGLGAIILIERGVGIAGFTEGGVQLGALVSAPLLLSIFFKDTPLHDGAVVIRGRRIVAAGCLLPLSENPNLSPALGTRHRAAVGATEENDAIAVVISEETQRISVAMRGELEIEVNLERLREILTLGADESDDRMREVGT